MIVAYILTFAFMNELDRTAPQFLKPMDSQEACLVEALKRNRTDERLRDQEVRARGGEFLCLKVERASI